MDATDDADLLTRLAAAIDAHDWDGLPDLLHADFTCRLVHTGEVFDKDTWVRFNAAYPGFQRMLVEDLVADGDRGELTEVWADVDQRHPRAPRPLA